MGSMKGIKRYLFLEENVNMKLFTFGCYDKERKSTAISICVFRVKNTKNIGELYWVTELTVTNH